MAVKGYKVGKPGTRASKKGATSPRKSKKDKAPRQHSPRTQSHLNLTSHRPGQSRWSWENLPDILYQIEPLESDRRRDKAGFMDYQIHGKTLRDLPVLPDNISSSVEEFRVEAWQRLDSRIFLDDITDRMHPDFRIKNNALQQRGVRFRQAFMLKAWRSGNKRTSEFSDVLKHSLLERGIDPELNSTRGLTPGLIDPMQGEAGGRVDLPIEWRKRKLGESSLASLNQDDSESDDETSSTEASEIPSQASDTSSEAGTEVPDLSSQGSDASSQAAPEDLGFLPDADADTNADADAGADTDTDANDDVEEQGPQMTTFAEQEAQLIEFTHQYVPYEEDHMHLAGSIPVIRGIVPDGQLPSTVTMRDLELAFNVGQPTPEVASTNSNLAHLYHRRHRKSSTTAYRGSICRGNSSCFDRPQQYRSSCSRHTLSEGFALVPSKPQTPSTGLFDFNSPPLLDSFPESQQKNIFDDALDAFYQGERFLTEMPYYHIDA